MKKKAIGRPSVYEESLKVRIAEEFLHGDLSLTELARKYNLPTKGTVNSMVTWYRRRKEIKRSEGLESPVANSKSVENVHSEKIDADKYRSKERELEDALLKVEALELLLANAKKELGIDLLKKHGTKQPNK